MEVNLTPELEKQLHDAAAKAGCDAQQLAQDVIAGYLDELAEVRGLLEDRYTGVQTGKVRPIDGEAFFERPTEAR